MPHLPCKIDMIIRSGTDQVMIHTFNKRKLSSCWSILYTIWYIYIFIPETTNKPIHSLSILQPSIHCLPQPNLDLPRIQLYEIRSFKIQGFAVVFFVGGAIFGWRRSCRYIPGTLKHSIFFIWVVSIGWFQIFTYKSGSLTRHRLKLGCFRFQVYIYI